MNFTREPIIETIITPKEGYKLILRNSKGGTQEEYVVEAIEVVSFGHSFFFRSLERPKSFLVPVSDYEIVEAKETRVVLKNATFEKAIKIGGGREASIKPPREQEKPVQKEGEEEEVATPTTSEQRPERKRERRRNRRKRPLGEENKKEENEEGKGVPEVASEGGVNDDEMKVSSSPRSRLIPPPPTLISDKYIKERQEAAAEAAKGNVLPEHIVEPVEKKLEEQSKPQLVNEPKKRDTTLRDEDNIPPSPGGEMQRTALEFAETANSSTSFSTLEKKTKFSIFGKIW